MRSVSDFGFQTFYLSAAAYLLQEVLGVIKMWGGGRRLNRRSVRRSTQERQPLPILKNIAIMPIWSVEEQLNMTKGTEHFNKQLIKKFTSLTHSQDR